MSLRALTATLLLVLAATGCDLVRSSQDAGDATEGAAADTTDVQPDSVGQTGPDTAGAGPEADSADTTAGAGEVTGPASATPDSQASPPDSVAQGAGSQADTLPAPAAPEDSALARLEQELARVQAQNDSLRNSILGLVAMQRAPAGGRAQADTAVSAGEILGRGAEQVQHWGLRIFFTILFLIFIAGAVRAVVWLLDRLSERNAKRRLFFKRLVPITRILIWALAIPFAALVILGIDAQGILAAGAAIGVAVGFAAQDILKNIFGGIIVLFDQPFQVGDKVSVHGTYGEVVSIGLRSTRLVTPDDNLVTVPNSQVVQDQVSNANAGELNCQVVTDLYLPARVDEAKAKRLAFEAAASSPYVFLNKPISVLVKDEFREIFFTHVKVKAYVLDPRYEFLFMSDVTERARAAFREAGLLGPMHGVRAWVDLDRLPTAAAPQPDGPVEPVVEEPA